MRFRHVFAAIGLLTSAASIPAVAQDASPERAEAWRFDVEFGLATDDYSSGVTTNDHQISSHAKGTARFDDVFASVEFATDGDRPDLRTTVTAGYTPTLDDYAFEFTIAHDFYANAPEEGETDFDASVSYAFSDALELRAGTTLGIPDSDEVYVDLTAGVTYTMVNEVAINSDVLYEPDTATGKNSYLEVSAGVEVPIFDKFSASASLAYDAYLTDPSIASYAYWDAGVSYEFNEFATFDLRYYDNSLSAGNCADHADFDCSAAVIGSLTLTNSWPAASE